ncbi:hypothetical protein [Flavobacterium sp.]|uniref:hypothetical protein n=1 Tax=Flavobacterium sp. TaxID=239 RepID=UPI003BD53000
MKNVCFSLAFMLIGSFAFANTKEVKKETSKLTTSQTTNVVKQQQWTYRCSDGVVVQFECGCNQDQATAMGRAWCNNR